MFKLSKGAEYAIRGILHLSMQPDGKVSFIEEIADCQGVPKAYLAKIFQTLRKKGVLRSTRGQGGGFTLVKAPTEITVLNIIEVLEGPVSLGGCFINSDYCDGTLDCSFHGAWKTAQENFVNILKNCTFKDLAEGALRKLKE
ncbi:MAG: Rrf2 family transcriptional regulator [Deltaproteobacteria bacterium]|nr:Rrf2 family transcriptional regulator [Deltaproteobacteria bacterium]